MSTSYSRAKIAGHPIHPMLIAFPVTFYTVTFVAFLAYTVTHHGEWWQIALRANVAGLITAAVAAVPGIIDWATGIPKGTPAKATGRLHMLANLVSSGLFAINLFVHREAWGDMHMTAFVNEPMPDPGGALALTGLGLIALLTAGALGWKLVQTHHVGVDLSDEQRRLDERTAH